MNIDVAEVRRMATWLRDGVDDLQRQRRRLAARLATGVEARVPDKSKDDVKVLIGAVDFDHVGSQTGELIADRVKSCTDSALAVEDGMRAMSTLMERMATTLGAADELGATDLNEILTGLY
ncbi:MAG: hypothetical protein ACRD0P_30660, partial [Stackebrandtia sp.]